MFKEPLCQRLQMKANVAHPVGHEIAAKFDLFTRVDRLLTVERQSIGVFGDSNAGQQALCWQAAFNQMGGSRRLNDVLAAGGAGIAGTARNDNAELGGDDVETFGDVLSDFSRGQRSHNRRLRPLAL